MSATEWMMKARCAGEPEDFFFPEGPGPIPDALYDRARQFCDRCFVSRQCLVFALNMNEEYGMWGGKTPVERARLRSLLDKLRKEQERLREEQAAA